MWVVYVFLYGRFIPQRRATCTWWMGPKAGLFFGSKEKNSFPCRNMSPGSPGWIHDRSDNVKPLNYKLLDILGPDDTVRHLLRHFYRTSWRKWRQRAPWQWPVYRKTSCSKRHMSAAALVNKGPPVPGRLLHFVFLLFAMHCIAKILPRAA
jgi:hypothetical protein